MKDKKLAGKGKASNALRIKDRAVELRPGRGVKAGTGVTRLRLLSAVNSLRLLSVCCICRGGDGGCCVWLSCVGRRRDTRYARGVKAGRDCAR